MDGSRRPRTRGRRAVRKIPPSLKRGVVGLGTPTPVLSDTKQIVGGEAVFEAEYVDARSKNEQIHLFAHEIGHILGLGHSPDEGNIMNAVVTDQTALGPATSPASTPSCDPAPHRHRPREPTLTRGIHPNVLCSRAAALPSAHGPPRNQG